MTDSPLSPTATTPRRTWLALVVLMAGAFMSLLDTTIVNVALQSIRESLDASTSTLEWIISGYALAFGLTLIPSGRVGDRFGHKWVFVAGLSLFTVASVACGLAQDSTQLIVARVVQGAAGGIFFPAVTALIRIMFSGRSMGKAFGVLGAVLGLSAALGPIVGGLIIEFAGEELGWRLVFGVNLPIGLVAIIAAIALLPRERPRRSAAGVDVVGLILLSGGLVAILVPLIEGQTLGWPLWTYLTLVGGVLLLVAFAFWELHQARLDRNPIVPPSLFTHAAFSGGVILATVYFAAFTSIFFVITIFWQAGLGAGALEAGLVSLPFALGTIVGAANSDRLAQRLGRSVLALGVGMVTLGLIAIWAILLVAGAGVTNWMLLPALLVAGLGSGFFIAPNTEFIVATVDKAQAGAAGGVLGTAQRIGSAIGIAVIGSVFFGTLTVAGSGPDAVAEGFADSATVAIAVSAGFGIIAFALVFALPKRVDSPRRG
ncbi:MFS transporter [Marisediminicola senii]|uniref:MFS transporter n=1 Tax=Marisediminicola senii TaxID=2711233 RepID=UPI0013ED05AB|nr:MFS transporter [Marisediminicola senii]